MAINIGGISVHFPYKPYPSQLSMMNRTIQSIEKCQNCLLESPTGSGKSLALLCASLAWVEKQIEMKNKEYTLEFEDCCFSCDSSGLYNDYEDDSCKSEVPSGKIPCSKCDCHQLQKLSSMSAPPTKIPKIFYGTRTHKQISQLIRELKKTKYKDTNMTILSSRSHSCVNKTAIQSNNLTETCQDMIKHAGCEYYLRRKKSESHVKLGKLGLGNAWDIEDLVEVLSKAGSCPYYSARDLIADSLIVFCPYNYLLDPIFRDAVNLNLTNSIVILDEAHNIEDASREAASFSISDDQLNLALKNICDLITAQVKLDHTMPLKAMVESTLRLMELTKSRLMREGSEDTSQVWTGVEIVGLLKQINLGPETFQNMKKHFTALCEEESEERSSNEDKESNQLTLKATSKVLFESLFTVLDFIYKDNFKFRDDYRVAVIQSKSFDKLVWRQPNGDSNLGVWLSNSRQKNAPPKPTVSLNFWCLNSAVIFEDLGRMTRNIVLTSGTLSPLISFQSELGVLFPLRLEAQHVIPENQILVGSVGRGPSGSEICCTYQNSETFLFQDDIGNLILRAIKVVPHGVLCFLPSYSMMDKLINRWQFTGLLNDLKSVKHVMIEPRSSVHYETWIKEFNSYIQASERKFSGENGVLLFAVCRGKVSEGLDFADNRARLVLTIGIPFPNFKDSQVQLKRSYNDCCRTSCRLGEASNLNKNILSQANLLSGSEWYEVQAYRALNQALGRCIRHKDDWGAIIMVDVRFGSNPGRYMSGLSKWLRHRVVHYSHCDSMLESLSSFIKERVDADAAACQVSQPIDCEEDDNFRSSLSRFALNDSDDDDFKIIRRKKKRRRSSDNQESSVLNCLSNSSYFPQNETSLNTQPTDVVIDLTFDDNKLNSSFQCLKNTESTSYMPFNETPTFTKQKKPLQARSRKKKSIFD